MPPKQQTTKTANDNTTEDDDFQIEVAETVPLRTRGRTLDPKTIKVRDALMASQQDKTARSFKGVDNKDKREEYARRVRAAAKLIDPDFKVTTIWAEDEQKLYWGPEDVIKELQKQRKQPAAASA